MLFSLCLVNRCLLSTITTLVSLTAAGGHYTEFNNLWEDSPKWNEKTDERLFGVDERRALAMKDMRILTIPVVKMENNYIPPIMYDLYEEMNQDTCNDRLVVKLTPTVFEHRADKYFLEFEIPSKSEVGFLIKSVIRSELRMVFSEHSIQPRQVHLQFEDLFNFPMTPSDPTPLGPVFNSTNSLNDIEKEMVWNVTEITNYSYRRGERMIFIASVRFPEEMEPLSRIKYVYMMLYQKTKMDCKSNNYPNTEVRKKSKYPIRKKNKENKQSSHLCKRKGMYVDFEEIGWDTWIMSPTGYKAYFCEGKCPFSDTGNLNGSNHAIIQSLMNTHQPQIPEATCSAKQLSGITMLYLDHNNNLILRQYSDMVVEACGCK